MKEVQFENLIIEVTRRCNLVCDHCLRGEQQNTDIKDSYIDNLFKNISVVNTLTITGGEPSLVPNKIKYIIDSAKRNNVEIQRFYLATNAYDISNEFIMVLMELYLYCYDNENSLVNISNDIFHDLDSENVKKLQCLSFVKKKYEEDNHNYSNGRYIIRQGFGFDTATGNKDIIVSSLTAIEDDNYINFIDEHIYLNAEGNILIGCDYSYENQDYNIICSYADDIIKELKEISVTN